MRFGRGRWGCRGSWSRALSTASLPCYTKINEGNGDQRTASSAAAARGGSRCPFWPPYPSTQPVSTAWGSISLQQRTCPIPPFRLRRYGLCKAVWRVVRRPGSPHLGAQHSTAFRKLGYGDIAGIPTWYALKFFDARLGVAALLPGARSAHIAGGFRALWDAVGSKAATLGVDLRLNTVVTRVSRNQRQVVLETDTGEFEADHLVLAIAPAQIRTALADLNDQERDLLEGIRTTPIVTVLAEVAGAEIENQIGGQLIPTDEAVTMIGLWPWTRPGHAGTVWYVSPQGAGLDPGDDPPEGWESWIRSRHLLPEGCYPTRVIEVRHWTEYFPHFTPEALAAGALEQLSTMQGARRTYFLGGWTTFELVEDIISQAEALIGSQFPIE